jgi:hypothetical protein
VHSAGSRVPVDVNPGNECCKLFFDDPSASSASAPLSLCCTPHSGVLAPRELPRIAGTSRFRKTFR